MTMEQKLKNALGEHIFAIIALQYQIEQLQEELNSLKESKKNR